MTSNTRTSACAVLFAAIVLAGCHQSRVHSVKMVMPGKYTIPLTVRDCGVWVFTRWKSKGIDSNKALKPTVRIIGRSGGVVPITPARSDSDTLRYPDEKSRYGKILGLVNLGTDGPYTIEVTGGERFVLLLIPGDALWTDLGSGTRFEGDDNDEYFLSPLVETAPK